jgi:hypothetical protein
MERREALLCIQVDKMSLHEVAALCRRPAERQRQSADEFADAQRDAILALEPGGELALAQESRAVVARRVDEAALDCHGTPPLPLRLPCIDVSLR